MTNGVTPRRWIAVSNPRLTGLITEAIGEKWLTNLDELKELEKMADDSSFQDAWCKVKEVNKQDAAVNIMGQLDIYSRKIWDVKPFPVELKWQRLPEDGVLFTHRKSAGGSEIFVRILRY